MERAAAFFSGPYDEALALVVEARNYAAFMIDSGQRRLEPGVRLQVSFESLRVTARLTQAMAWLLAQKAVYAGEITVDDLASEQYALSGEDVCHDNDAATNEALPGGLRSLLQRSHLLYQRVARLDRLVRRRAAGAGSGGPPPETHSAGGWAAG